MLKRPSPKKLSPEEISQISAASAEQTGKAKAIRTYDSDFPVFEIPVNSKVLAYIPNHTILKPDGTTALRADKFAAHPCTHGRQYLKIRCSQGIVSDMLGLDGTCPFCDSVPECWELVNAEFASAVKAKGGDPSDPNIKEDKRFESDWKECRKNFAVGGGQVYLTFPIVVIDCIEKDGKMTTIPKKDENNRISGKVMWYTILEKTFEEKWKKALETAPSPDGIPPETPAGLWVVLNYEYVSESGKHDKMTSAQKLAVGYKAMQGYEPWEAEFDKMSEDWTPAKAMEVVVDNVLRDKSEMDSACDEIMKTTRDKLAVFKLASGNGAAVPASAMIAGGAASSAEATLASFSAKEALPDGEVAPSGVPQGVPQAGISTDVV